MTREQMSRRTFLTTTSAVVSGMAIAGSAKSVLAGLSSSPGLTAADLPKGDGPLPLLLPHFPDRLHAFIWRNWPLVPVQRMARVVGSRPDEILKIGRAMGLGRPPRISSNQWRRSYITVIKRNWHLLPYEQLLDLLGWGAEQLAFTLREDDFLFVKLGNHKPACPALRYSRPDENAIQRQREIAQVLAEELPQNKKGEEPFSVSL